MQPRVCFPNAFMIDSSTIKNNEEVVIRVVVHKSTFLVSTKIQKPVRCTP